MSLSSCIHNVCMYVCMEYVLYSIYVCHYLHYYFCFQTNSIQNQMELKSAYGGSSGVPKELTPKGIDVGVSLLFLKCV